MVLLPAWCLLLELTLLAIFEMSLGQMRRCNYQERPPKQKYRKFGNVSGFEQYCHDTSYCMGIYTIEDHGELEVDTLSCYLKKACSEDLGCVSFRNNILVCICDGDLCNNITSWSPEAEPFHSSTAGILASGLVLVLLLLCFTAVTLIIYKKTKSPQSPIDPLCASTKPSDIEDLELQKVLDRGGFAAVWEGRHRGVRVAVKVFSTTCKHAFSAERAVHQLPSMAHPNIVRFLGSGSLGPCRVILLEYATHGSLHSYLSAHSSSWTSSLTLCQSLSQGLSYLHEQGVHKPAVAHGDLSSSNVLVKADGTCALCDFGCSTILHFRSGHNQHWPVHFRRTQAEGGNGTLRYMSPEILEGSVVLNMSWRLQADVYSLSLVLWEVWMRCSDLFGERVPSHLLPYEQELGNSVTLESLLHHVLSLDRRPPIPEAWQQHPQGEELAALLSCCWDPDADARLSAACVVERLASFQFSTKENTVYLVNLM